MERSGGSRAGVADPGAKLADQKYRLERLGLPDAVVPGDLAEELAFEEMAAHDTGFVIRDSGFGIRDFRRKR
jgi:hypothetical protein